MFGRLGAKIGEHECKMQQLSEKVRFLMGGPHPHTPRPRTGTCHQMRPPRDPPPGPPPGCPMGGGRGRETKRNVLFESLPWVLENCRALDTWGLESLICILSKIGTLDMATHANRTLFTHGMERFHLRERYSPRTRRQVGGFIYIHIFYGSFLHMY